jgi:SAM-dependent methyltransferase
MSVAAAVELMCSGSGLDLLVKQAMDYHLYFIHRSRLVAIRRLLPAASRILDLGGANSPLYHMGYGHAFSQMVMIDLPPEQRHSDWARVDVPSVEGDVNIFYGDMTDLSAFESGSFDMVWSGQSIEHVPVEAARRMVHEAHRVLAPGGHLCLDTPNRALTRIHTQDWHGGYIHPEHHYEYQTHELRALLQDAGFEVVVEKGICQMPETVATGRFHYSDFILGNPISDSADDAYILYFDGIKRN